MLIYLQCHECTANMLIYLLSVDSHEEVLCVQQIQPTG